MNLIFDIGYNKGSFTKKCFETYPGVRVVGVEANRALIDIEWWYKSAKSLGIANFQKTDFMHEAHVTLEANANTGDFALIYGLAGPPGLDGGFLHVCTEEPGISTASTQFREHSRFAAGSTILPVTSNWDFAAHVPSITLDTLVERFGSPDLIKIDVEGYEYEVLQGLTTRQNTICFEWTEEMPVVLQQSVKYLQNLGYEEFGIIGHFAEGKYPEEVTSW